MKPDWSKAPKWANWLAMDEDGYWVWYEDRPSWCGGEEENEWLCDIGFRVDVAGKSDDVEIHASKTLEPRP